MKKIKIIVDKVIHPGGEAAKDDVIEVDDKSADYFVTNGYAETWTGTVKKTTKKATKKTVAQDD